MKWFISRKKYKEALKNHQEIFELELNNKDKEIDNLRGANARLVIQTGSLDAKVEELNKRIANLNRRYDNSLERSSSLKDKIFKLESRNEELECENAKAYSELAVEKVKMDDINKENKRLYIELAKANAFAYMINQRLLSDNKDLLNRDEIAFLARMLGPRNSTVVKISDKIKNGELKIQE